MQKNRIAVRILDTYFNTTLGLRVQIYNLLAFIGIAAGFGVATIAIIMKISRVIVLIDFSVAGLSFLLLQIAEKKGHYHLCSWIFVIVVFFIFFPILFFVCGGYKSGAANSFLIAFVFTAILLEGYERVFALMLELILYLSCLLVVFYRPETAYAAQNESETLFFVILNFTTTGAILLTVLLMRTQIYQKRHEQIGELNRELTARNKTLARYDTMKSDFLATVAHEINTPLAVIAASSNDTIDLLKENPLNIGGIIENQEVIERRVKLIDSILLDLIDIVAIENGRLSLNRQPIFLFELLKNSCDVQFKRLDMNNNSIAYDIQPGLQRVWADPLRIEQVIMNLLSNACKHTKNGIIKVKLVQAQGNQVVSVADNGDGMDAEMARVALRQYVSTKTDFWRHGIGLSICRRIIVAHGGEIWIESEKGRGTSISFLLREQAEYE
jgi:signal transduction histidine kinase